MFTNTFSLGKWAENQACNILLSKGYKILTKNFRSKFGEIDIVALHQNTLVFVEVKARQNTKFGYPEEAVTNIKIQKIIKTANYYMLVKKPAIQKMKIEVFSLIYSQNKIVSYKIIQVI